MAAATFVTAAGILICSHIHSVSTTAAKASGRAKEGEKLEIAMTKYACTKKPAATSVLQPARRHAKALQSIYCG